MSQSNNDFYPRKVRSFLKTIYSEQCLRSVNEILNVLDNDQAFHSRLFMHKKVKRNYIIVCQIHVGHFLLEEERDCVMADGECFRFGEECLGKYFCYNCLSDALELMKTDCRSKFFNEWFFFALVY